MVQYLPFTTAKVLYDAGLRLKTDKAYMVVEGRKPANGGPPISDYDAVLSACNDAKSRGFICHIVPAPSLCELLPSLPTTINTHYLTLIPIWFDDKSTIWHIFYDEYGEGKYRFMATFICRDPCPCQAAADLLLKLLQMNVIDVETVNALNR